MAVGHLQACGLRWLQGPTLLRYLSRCSTASKAMQMNYVDELPV